MEIKVGQWARGHCFETGVEKTVIGEIIKIDLRHPMGYKIKSKDNEYWLINITQIKPADNLEDLLMVGDIVHYETKFFKDDAIIRSENAIRLVKEDIKNNKLKITAIELAENRKPIKIGSESDE